MCWYGKLSDKKIAEKDITVYKVLEKRENDNGKMCYWGPFQYLYGYAIGHKYKEIIKVSTLYYEDGINNDRIIINNGLHCFSENAYVKAFNRPYYFEIGPNREKTNIGKGTWLFKKHINVICKCTIPKGSTYYINNNNEIVTSALIVEEDLGTPEKSCCLRNITNNN